MRAVVIKGFGAEPELVEIPVPEPEPGELLIRIHAAGLNPFDWKVADGALDGMVEHAFPFVMGSDGAGVVTAVGSDVTDFHPGDRVYGQFMGLPRGQGSFAEYVVVAETGKVARIPDGVPFTVAAALPTASITAYQAVQAAALAPGHTILVNGASGGVGQSAVQFAAGGGARVLATAPGHLAEHLRDLGADHIVDFTVAPTLDQVRAAHPDGIDAVLDLITGPGGANPFAALLRPGGVLVSTNGAAEPERLASLALTGVNLYNNATRQDLEALAVLADQGQVRVRIDAEVPLAEVPNAVARARTSQATGKTIIVP
ncbi:NADP-dependent oxidoreductase [Pengzhenrongella sp.]|jgi:NADPH:quinone reductase-like Zn-dependent oxidoreductase|uniref:NADP-dependent oxidoreductase n=1 Tax=Pengzhenrongella sp. TaxID=2888820 RepID=UPI002F9397B3